jgi:hypothetical protein
LTATRGTALTATQDSHELVRAMSTATKSSLCAGSVSAVGDERVVAEVQPARRTASRVLRVVELALNLVRQFDGKRRLDQISFGHPDAGLRKRLDQRATPIAAICRSGSRRTPADAITSLLLRCSADPPIEGSHRVSCHPGAPARRSR